MAHPAPNMTPPYLEDLVRRRTEELEAALCENERMNNALRESESRFRGLVNQSLAGIAMIEEGHFTYVNTKLAEMFGYGVEEFLNLDPLETATKADRQNIKEQMDRCLAGEVDHVSYVFNALRKNSAILDVECHSSVMEIGGRTVLINQIIDVTERVRADREVGALQKQLREQATRDPLTGLYNRFPLNEVFDREISLAERYNGPITVVMADLDHFKTVNDTCGHLAGDEALRVLSRLFLSVFRTADLHCRFGGDEFLILLPGMAGEVAFERTEQLRKTLEATEIAHGPAPMRVTATFGIASYPDDGRTQEALIAAADRALYEGKRSGRNRVIKYQESLLHDAPGLSQITGSELTSPTAGLPAFRLERFSPLRFPNLVKSSA